MIFKITKIYSHSTDHMNNDKNSDNNDNNDDMYK